MILGLLAYYPLISNHPYVGRPRLPARRLPRPAPLEGLPRRLLGRCDALKGVVPYRVCIALLCSSVLLSLFLMRAGAASLPLLCSSVLPSLSLVVTRPHCLYRSSLSRLWSPGPVLREQLRPDILLLNTGLWKALEYVVSVACTSSCLSSPSKQPKGRAPSLMSWSFTPPSSITQPNPPARTHQ